MGIRICYYFFGWDIIITFLVIAVVQFGTCPVWVRSPLPRSVIILMTPLLRFFKNYIVAHSLSTE